MKDENATPAAVAARRTRNPFSQYETGKDSSTAPMPDEIIP
jgi:hypothetical protein